MTNDLLMLREIQKNERMLIRRLAGMASDDAHEASRLAEVQNTDQAHAVAAKAHREACRRWEALRKDAPHAMATALEHAREYERHRQVLLKRQAR